MRARMSSAPAVPRSPRPGPIGDGVTTENRKEGKPRQSSKLVRQEQGLDEGRPFAEIRRGLHSVLGIVSLHRWAFFVPFCIVSSIAFIISLSHPRTYSASTSFERRNDPILFDLPLSAGAHASFDYFRSSMHTDLTSVNTMSEVADNLGLTKGFPRNEDGSLTADGVRARSSLARTLGSMLTVSRTSPSSHIDIINVTYKGPDASIGKRLVEEVKRVYIRRTMAWMQDFLGRQQEYFQREAAVALETLQEAQRKSAAYLLENPYANLTDPTLIATRLTQLETEKRELLMRRREYSAELEAAQQLLASLGVEPTPGPTALLSSFTLSPAALRLRQQLDEIDKEVETLRSSRGMTDQHPKIRELLGRAEQIRADMNRHADAAAPMPLETATVSSPAISAWGSERTRIQLRIDAEQAKIDEIDIGLQTIEASIAEVLKAKEGVFDKQDEFSDLASQVSKARQRHGNLEAVLLAIEPAINALSQNRLMQFIDGQPARGSSIPISPKSTTIVLLAVLAGLAAGAVVTVLAEVLDHVYRSSGQVVRGLGLPVLEAIDEIVTVQDRRRLLVRRAVLTPLAVLVLAGAVGLTGSMAYLSIERPWTYQRITHIPKKVSTFLDVDVKPTASTVGP